MRRYTPKRFVLLLSVILITSAGVVYTCLPRFEKRVMRTQRNLRIMRERITDLHNTRGAYPASLEDAGMIRDPNGVERRVARREYITSMDGCNTQSKELNGAGGWCYDPNTGMMRVNVNRPLKEYLWFYFGPERNERPSDW